MDRGQTHSIIITYENATAVAWYPDGVLTYHHINTSDGTIRPAPYKTEIYDSMSATEFIETYAEGTD